MCFIYCIITHELLYFNNNLFSDLISLHLYFHNQADPQECEARMLVCSKDPELDLDEHHGNLPMSSRCMESVMRCMLVAFYN